jgi:hypothetical protein
MYNKLCMKRKLITCPDCQSTGTKQNLAEVLDNGMISIQRIYRFIKPGDKKYKNHTIIGGSNICGNCGNKVFIRE